MALIVDAISLMLILVSVFELGKRRGRGLERSRCMWLLHSSLVRKDGRMSGSVRWVLNAVESGADELMPAAKFFGDAGSTIPEKLNP